jgi:glycosyltransferase involved in cell wall biosynthesis
MKIAVYTNAYKPIVSGVVNAVALFRQGLTDLGHEVIVLAPDYYGYRDQENGIYRYPSVDLTRRIRFPVAVPWSTRLGRVVRDFRPDVIHAHHPFVLGPVAIRMARHLQVPLIYTFHTQYELYSHYFPFPQELVKKAARYRIKHFIEDADLVTTPAESIHGLLASYGVTKDLVMLPNPVDLSCFQIQEGETVRKQLGLADGDLVMISIGRLGVEKNLGFMLDTFAAMLALAPDLPLKLLLVGDGPDEARLRELGTKLGLGERLVLAGSVPHLMVPSYLAVANLFLMTSISEVKPLVLLEAMGAGLPVVAIKATGVVDTITHGREGLLTELDKEKFARVAVGLLRDKTSLSAMARRARETVDRYALDKVTTALIAVYETAIGGGQGGNGVDGASGQA